jgi:hypothetical protein
VWWCLREDSRKDLAEHGPNLVNWSHSIASIVKWKCSHIVTSNVSHHCGNRYRPLGYYRARKVYTTQVVTRNLIPRYHFVKVISRDTYSSIRRAHAHRASSPSCIPVVTNPDRSYITTPSNGKRTGSPRRARYSSSKREILCASPWCSLNMILAAVSHDRHRIVRCNRPVKPARCSLEIMRNICQSSLVKRVRKVMRRS